MKGTLLLSLSMALGSPMATTALPQIHEVFYDAEGADRAFVFTEIFGLPGDVLDGYRLVGIDGATGAPYRTVDLAGAIIPDDGLLVVATSRALGDVLLARDFIGEVDWQNGPDAIQLWSPLGAIVDALQYGDGPGLSAGEGVPAPDVLAGFALSRDPEGTDTGNNFADFAVGRPTPGLRGVPGASVPEPRPLLLAAAVASLFGATRKRYRGEGLRSRTALARTMMSNPSNR